MNSSKIGADSCDEEEVNDDVSTNDIGCCLGNCRTICIGLIDICDFDHVADFWKCGIWGGTLITIIEYK
jgi:hypothetical protein